MAEYLIQDTTLDAIADAINAKTGGSSAMTPAEMVTAIGTISGGGGYTLQDYIKRERYGDFIDDTITAIADYCFSQCSPGFDVIRVPNCTVISRSAFYLCVNEGSPTMVFAPKANIGSAYGGSVFYGCSRITIVVAKNIVQNDNFRKYSYEMQLATVDLTNQTTAIGNNNFSGCVNLKTLILRNTTPCGLGNIGAFAGTPFASGGSGGTIYIPKVLYDHLGDGTSLDYKAATNWSTIDGYGTITWAQIEGSQYEHYYADGTPIPSE